MVSRKGFNLFSKLGRKNFKSEGWKCAKYYVWGDTFKPILCKIFGHKIEKSHDDNSTYCSRCWQYIKISVKR
jgi:hypothetical protein